uniref:Peptide-N(4)-(N-acetyl-beta-glucosaminyl)asparagine amidase n=1 Tax=Aceria tosichella TaxID=561515 RepID=A0A6G1S633_9ACAR
MLPTSSQQLDQMADSFYISSLLEPWLVGVLRACRDKSAHLEAKELVPLGEILQDNLNILDDESNYKDNLLPLVTNWFSSDFFKWFETPNCERCSTTMSFRMSYINAEKKQVESWICDRDGFEFTFVRHNEPAILLRTRTGRCGEWAMCFFVILRALDYHARIVHDSADHVWTEVWSETKKQFIHVDPCENTVDSPLLYETGWGKKLEYCFAMSQYEVQDVTKRYSIDYAATLRRRTRFQESSLIHCLNQMNQKLLALAPSDRIRDLVSERRRRDMEVIDQLAKSPRQIPDKCQLAGRKTGSVQWRISRGEYQISAKKGTVVKIKPNDSKKEDSEPIFALYYNCDKNAYQSTANEYRNLSNWSCLVYEYENLDFKYERDWKTSYVARYECCPHNHAGRVRWRFDLNDLVDLDWHTVEILVTGKLYPDTSISITITGYKSEDCSNASSNKELSLNQLAKITRAELSPETKYMDILVVMSGGFEDDGVAWQKPQLFRQTRGQNADQPALSLKFY